MMTRGVTEWLQQSRLIVVAVDTERRRLRVKSDAEVCADLSCHEDTVVIADNRGGHDLAALNPGDIIKVSPSTENPDAIVVLRRVWEELASPEL
jgi:hypothetical protein